MLRIAGIIMRTGSRHAIAPLFVLETVTTYVSANYYGNDAMSESRHIKLFRSGRSQIIHIPVEFELPGSDAIMRRDGGRLVIEPVRKRGLTALLKSMKPLDEHFPEIDDPKPTPVDE